MSPIISVSHLSKTYASGFKALTDINLDIREGEIFALLGPNGAGKTTLISIICGIVNPSAGTVTAGGHDIIRDYPCRALADRPRAAGAGDLALRVGVGDDKLQPWPVQQADRSGPCREDSRQLTLWDKKDSQIVTLSGGMKRRVMIAKALAHEPRILFLDEPTAGVDVELRREMWDVVRGLREAGVTIILTTHYIEEAEMMADRVGVINKGELVLVEEKADLMRKLGGKELTLQLHTPLAAIPPALAAHNLELADNGGALVYAYDTRSERTGITALLSDLAAAGIRFRDLQTNETSLEDIFVNLVRNGK